ncbi:unnamed protein product [Rhodiola kirilowii]
MGSVCCVSAKGMTTSDGANGEILRRTIQYSPSWGVRWDNRGRVAGEEAPAVATVDRIRQNCRLERKSEPFFEPLPEVGMSEENLEANPQKLLFSKESSGTLSKADISESPEPQSISIKVKEITETPAALDPLSTVSDKPSASYLSTSPLPPKAHLAPTCSTPLKWSPNIPRSHLLRQGSDGQLCRHKSPSNHSVSEGRSSPLLPVSSIEFARGSHGWTVQSYPESTTSTHMETWSLDRPSLSSQCQKLQSHSQKSDSHSNDLKNCVVCSKNVDVYVVVAILVCGHVYHADCLEHLTPEISKYDPTCPICTFGEKRAMKMFEKVRKSMNLDFIPLVQGGSTPRLVSRSSLRSSLAKPFLKRHFSFSSKASSSSSENHPAKARSLLLSKSSK